MIALILMASLLPMFADVPATCDTLEPKDYAIEWALAKKLMAWEGNVYYPHKVKVCNYAAFNMDKNGNLTPIIGVTDWRPTLTKRGRMGMKATVISFLPHEHTRSQVLTHEFLHVLRGRLRHVKDPRARGNDEEFICTVYPEGCSK